MKRALRSSEAKKDVEEIVAYYSKHSLSAANRFIDEYEAAIRKIESMPNAGSLRFATELGISGLRIYPLKDFPHIVFYVERAHQIGVVRIIHSSRDIFTLLSGIDWR